MYLCSLIFSCTLRPLRVPCTCICPCQSRRCIRADPAVSWLSLLCIPRLSAPPALCKRYLFLFVYPILFSTFDTAAAEQPNTSPISYRYASGCAARYSSSFWGSTFLKYFLLSLSSRFPCSSSCFFQRSSAVLPTLKTFEVSVGVCPSSRYFIARSRKSFEH